VGLKGAGGSACPDDASTATSNASEERSERAVDRRETAIRSNGDQQER